MAGFFTHLFSRAGTGERAEAAEPAAGDEKTELQKTQLIVRKPLAWSADGQTVPVREQTGSRLAWPARDRAKAPAAHNTPHASESTVDDVPTQFVGHDNTTPEQPPPARPIDRTSRKLDDDSTRYVGADGVQSQTVAGWLVIVDGPGRGNALQIGTGQNTIGRGPNQQLRLDFGDPGISRDRHAVLIYEPEVRKFYLQAGDVRGLTYVNKNVVLTPVELAGGETITVGQTQLRFVAFCGPQFGW